MSKFSMKEVTAAHIADYGSNGELDLIKFYYYMGYDMSKALKQACVWSHADVVDFLCDKIPLPRNVLHSACFGDDLNIFVTLLTRTSIHTQTCFEGLGDRNPILKAAELGHMDMIKQLYNYGADMNYCDDIQQSALHYAIFWDPPYSSREQHWQLVELLLDLGVRMTPSASGKTPLHTACIKGLVSSAKVMIDRDNNIVNISDNEGRTPLHYAVNHEELMQLLLSYNPELIPDNKGNTPLHYACRVNKPEVVKLLLKVCNKDMINKANKTGETALHYECGSTPKAIEPLLMAGANPMAMNENNETPLHIRVKHYLSQTDIDLLVQYGATSTPDKRGVTPLHLACRYDLYKTVSILLETNPEMTVDDSGKTPIMYAEKGSMVEQLMKQYIKNH